MTPLGAVARGLAAGALGTVAMDVSLFARYRRGGGDGRFAPWEFSSGVGDWEQAPAPAQVGKRLVEGLFQLKLPPERAALVNNVTHWAYGMLGGAQYGIVAGSLRSPRIRYGLPFGALEGQLKEEAAAGAHFALHLKIAAHQGHQPTADCKAQAGTAIAPGGG